MSRILFLGDIVGRPGREAVTAHLATWRQELGVSLVIANGENAAAGAGITAAIAHELHAHGVDAITLGDHCWDQRGFEAEIGDLPFLCRPANLPPQCPGRDHLVVEVAGKRLAILTLLGVQFMKIHADDPFRCSQDVLKRLRRAADWVFVEVHAETTSEKRALGYFLDGQALAVIGTHTHVPTADACLLPRGTAYLTDAGMSGPYESVLGREIQPVIARFLDGMPRRLEVATGDVRLCGCLIEVDDESGMVVGFERVERRCGHSGERASPEVAE